MSSGRRPAFSSARSRTSWASPAKSGFIRARPLPTTTPSSRSTHLALRAPMSIPAM